MWELILDTTVTKSQAQYDSLDAATKAKYRKVAAATVSGTVRIANDTLAKQSGGGLMTEAVDNLAVSITGSKRSKKGFEMLILTKADGTAFKGNSSIGAASLLTALKEGNVSSVFTIEGEETVFHFGITFKLTTLANDDNGKAGIATIASCSQA